ncbi:NAD(P)-binding domain-containing protein [Mycoplasmopsis caviae]|uniref:Glycerol-3-phosphate dehydrogenase n=1 Tax=Mycoplasmopsis caviae TaxID=55603 RepID=A0A3P8L6S1_9BACT|nr:NAD(P)H-dependent glycerol-3-phosphate dehydrogenase [Mycoplasmopsis caviae]UUD35499.1 NAD(P)-binding domain-containing protein [Mycoplasmopsis caviae]VDR41725.1 glycerol-3-phosphate dehydrogenase [Mycoplasmopsis caviae]
MKKVTIIGTGAWASALATVLTKNNNKVLMWGIDQFEVDSINKGKNPKYFSNTLFNNAFNVKATLDLKEALCDFDYLLLAVPSSAIVSVLNQIKKIIGKKKINVINVAKGIDDESKQFFSEVLVNQFSDNLKNYCTLIGPSFATEVFENVLTMINVVGPKVSYLKEMLKLFNNDTFRLVLNENEHGSELFAALKNVLAIGIGMLDYSLPYRNTMAALLSIGVKEIHMVYKAIFPNSNDNMGFELAGIGDIFLTCSSPKSRNFSFGRQVAEFGLEATLKVNNKTIEGYHAAKILDKILRKNKDLKTVFLRSIIDILHRGKKPELLLDFVKTYN